MDGSAYGSAPAGITDHHPELRAILASGGFAVKRREFGTCEAAVRVAFPTGPPQQSAVQTRPRCARRLGTPGHAGYPVQRIENRRLAWRDLLFSWPIYFGAGFIITWRPIHMAHRDQAGSSAALVIMSYSRPCDGGPRPGQSQGLIQEQLCAGPATSNNRQYPERRPQSLAGGNIITRLHIITGPPADGRSRSSRLITPRLRPPPEALSSAAAGAGRGGRTPPA
jgi:hypothetical protein